MLFWESDDTDLGEVHHLMVLCYYIQHPSLYSPGGLSQAIQMLREFLSGMTPAEMRQRLASSVSSTVRDWKIAGTPESHGTYPRPVAWTVTAVDVVAQGKQHYRECVRAWAQSVCDSLTAADIK
jgi:hypothetical protein